MADRSIEPMAVAQQVEAYAATEHEEARKWENRELLDESGVYQLHELAARIYALGFNDGRNSEMQRYEGKLRRERDAARASREEGKE